MAYLHHEYSQRMKNVLQMKANRKVKVYLLQGLLAEMRLLHMHCDNIPVAQPWKARNHQALSTGVSECTSVGYQLEKEVEELEERILNLRTVKFQQNQHIEALEEELNQKELIAIAKSDYNDRLKHKMLMAMQQAQTPKQRQKSVLNKSLDAVTNILTFRWW